MLPHDLGLKGFYPGRDKYGLEGMTQTLTMIGASEGDPVRCSSRIKIFILKSDNL
jgi:hypothetical protein